jgi:uncharacterized membrane protein
MTKRVGTWDDVRLEQIIGNLLRTGVALAAVVVLAGGIAFLIHNGKARPDYHSFHGEPVDLRSVSAIVHDAASLSPRGIIQFGLLLLILTPIARVVFSVFAFGMGGDRMYVVITLVVLGVLLYSLLFSR